MSMITLSFILKLGLGIKAWKESSAWDILFPEPQLKTKRYIIPQTAKVHILCNFISFFFYQTGGLKSHDMTAALVAQKLMAHMQVDPKCLAQIINIMKNVSENGVPAVEIARVFNDGIMPPEMVEYLATQALEAVAQDITPVDVDAHVQLYDNLRLKSNIPLEVIEFVENKLVQVI